jgi:hypothetical protein
MKKAMKQNEQTQDAHFSPSLDAAIAAWNSAQGKFQMQRCSEHQDAYMKTSDELGQAISQWQLSNPALAEQFAMWFDSHPA